MSAIAKRCPQIIILGYDDRVKKITIAKIILSALAVGGVLTIVAIAPNSLQMLKMFGINKKRYKSQSVYRTLKRMEKQNIIKVIKEMNNKTTISITRNGKKRLVEYSIDDMEIKKPKIWDGKWRIISFDIPEKQKTAREALRMKLKDFDFYHLQKSLFACPFPCRDEIDFVSEIFKIRKHITYFETSTITNELAMKKYFNLL